jgi:hypothetical protein
VNIVGGSARAEKSFEATVEIDPGNRTDLIEGLGIAIAEAAKAAAGHLAQLGKGSNEETFFSVSSIQVGVKPNPGPTAYKVTITPGG